MNEPAQKEPSMDEILSSIRQIIADDDAASETGGKGAPAMKAAEPGGEKASAPPEAEAISEPEAASEPEPASDTEPPAQDLTQKMPEESSEKMPEEPLALSSSQIVDEGDKPQGESETMLDEAVSDAEATHGAPAPAPSLVVPDDVAFDGHSETGTADEADARPAEPEDDPAPSPLPDPSLSEDLAGRLLAPTADAVTRHAFGQLNSVALAGRQRTVEDLIREMLRPMLKGWLDENLPGMVERMVQREIERISKGR